MASCTRGALVLVHWLLLNIFYYYTPSERIKKCSSIHELAARIKKKVKTSTASFNAIVSCRPSLWRNLHLWRSRLSVGVCILCFTTLALPGDSKEPYLIRVHDLIGSLFYSCRWFITWNNDWCHPCRFWGGSKKKRRRYGISLGGEGEKEIVWWHIKGNIRIKDMQQEEW